MPRMATHSNQLTLRGLDPRVLREIRRIARVNGISLNKAALLILRRGAGIEEAEPGRSVGTGLDRFIGSWTAAQAREFSCSTQALEQIDGELWK
jgi:hypothetical protein